MEKGTIRGKKLEIELRISFESATLAAYDRENRTFVASSVPALYALTYAIFHRYSGKLCVEFQLGIDAKATATSARSDRSTPLQRKKVDARP